MRILTLIEQSGLTWAGYIQQYRLFHVCCQVYAELTLRHPGETWVIQDIGEVPDRFADEVKEILVEILPQAR